jgi:L-lysine 2,3-aminomutase
VDSITDKIVARLALEQQEMKEEKEKKEENEKKALEKVKETKALNELKEDEKALKELKAKKALKALKEKEEEKVKKVLKEKEEALENARGKLLAFENDKHPSKKQLALLKDAVKKLEAEVEDIKNVAHGIVARGTLTCLFLFILY